jgi:hypothetical protein
MIGQRPGAVLLRGLTAGAWAMGVAHRASVATSPESRGRLPRSRRGPPRARLGVAGLERGLHQPSAVFRITASRPPARASDSARGAGARLALRVHERTHKSGVRMVAIARLRMSFDDPAHHGLGS